MLLVQINLLLKSLPRRTNQCGFFCRRQKKSAKRKGGKYFLFNDDGLFKKESVLCYHVGLGIFRPLFLARLFIFFKR